MAGSGGTVQNLFCNWTTFFDFKFKNTSDLIFPGFKLPSESFLFKNFKTGLIFWHMWCFNFQNFVRSCQHISGTVCIWGNESNANSWKLMKIFPDFFYWIKHTKLGNLWFHGAFLFKLEFPTICCPRRRHSISRLYSPRKSSFEVISVSTPKHLAQTFTIPGQSSSRPVVNWNPVSWQFISRSHVPSGFPG